jgi:hypothetical protein
MTAKKKKATTKKAKKSNKTPNQDEVRLDPEVEAFANWFADWWLRRGHRLYKAAKEADPDFAKKRKRSKRKEERLPFYWDEETERLVLDRNIDSSDPRSRKD